MERGAFEDRWSVVIWLMNILNAVVELEVVPGVLKRGVVVPVYMQGARGGGGKDPLKTDSYRGITLTSTDSYGGITLTLMVAKVLEFLVLERLQMVLAEADLPHINQTAYRKSASCADHLCYTGSHCMPDT